MGVEYYSAAAGTGSDANAGSDAEPKLKLPGPPAFTALRKWEDELPQHNLDLPFPEGKTGRYVKFSNQMNFVGWNNCLNERLMNLHLAHASHRAYVFSPFLWAPEHYPWPAPQHPPGGPRTPLNALLAGPLAGGAWDPSDPAPRSVSEAWWDVVCPRDERKIVYTQDIKPLLVGKDALAVFEYWAKLLGEAVKERCVEVVPPAYEVDSMPQIFDLWLWGTTRILDLFPSFLASPASRLLSASPIVLSALDRNAYLFLPRGPRPPSGVSRNPYDRMLAIHLRRGDYLRHCRSLAAWGSTYYSWALLPNLTDRFEPLPAEDPAREEKMLAHCLPTAEQLVKRIAEVREDYVQAAAPTSGKRYLDVLYLLTNEHGSWLDGVKKEMVGMGWNTIITTRDLVLDPEQEEVSMAVDMEVGRRAAVFVGNGWSSFTSNIIHQRFADGRDPISIRLT
ncbi:hypothetical protein C8F04DRAFT_938835 [Mycena alexandri]|uniref:Uncharacterized protein n=1 Tax=Mycena alexandri TaxID=1745969 RepID=A0AAD6TI13_9AGAR|nr:hypothetical protein C8F04DRAFT_938835 [Mycena alexandri]